MLNKNISLFVLASVVAMFAVPLVSSAQTGPCASREVTWSETATKACAQEIQTQERAKGYDVSCTVELSGSSPADYSYWIKCRLGGSLSPITSPHPIRTGQISIDSAGCVKFLTNPMTPSVSQGLTALGEILVQENLLLKRNSLVGWQLGSLEGVGDVGNVVAWLPSSDTLVGDGVYKYKAKYKIPSNLNMTFNVTNDGLSGYWTPAYSTYEMDQLTMNFMNSKCYRVGGAQSTNTGTTGTTGNTGTTGTTNLGTISSVNYASSLLQIINRMVVNLKAQLQSIQTNTTSTTQTGSQTTTNTPTLTSSSNQSSVSSTGCVIFNTNLEMSSWGTDVNALGKIMTQEGLMADRPDLGIANAYDTILYDSVYKYQVKYKILSNTSTTFWPETNTYSFVYGSGKFDTITRNFVNSRCYKL